MESPRAHPFQIILAFVFLLSGFFVGLCTVFLSTSHIARKENNIHSFLGANTIMTKRNQAIKEALKKGKDVYEFEVSGFYPALSRN